MIVELIPKKAEKPVFGQVFFLIVSLAALVGVAVSFFILQQVIGRARLDLDILEKQLMQDTRPQEEKLVAKLSGYKQKVEDFKFVAGERKNFLPFFELLERTTHPDIFFINLERVGDKNIMFLGGETKDFFALEQQRLLWKKEKEFQTVQLKEMLLSGEGNGSFKVEFTLSPELLVP
ncbi:MAG: hypothetical protein AAB524_01350 [Patescibacteria group bacterium]